jgi:hypothetical protein
MTTGIVVAGLVLGGLVSVAFWAGSFVRPSVALGRVEHELADLRAEVVGYRAAHEHLVGSLDRRLHGLEQTTAHAANEVRMASNQLLARDTVDHAGTNGATA